MSRAQPGTDAATPEYREGYDRIDWRSRPDHPTKQRAVKQLPAGGFSCGLTGPKHQHDTFSEARACLEGD